ELAPAVGPGEAAAGERLDVGAAREGLARAGHDRGPDVRLCLDALPAGAQLVLHLLVHRVLPLGAIERDGGDPVGDLEAHGVHAASANTKAGGKATRSPRSPAPFPCAARLRGPGRSATPAASAPVPPGGALGPRRRLRPPVGPAVLAALARGVVQRVREHRVLGDLPGQLEADELLDRLQAVDVL